MCVVLMLLRREDVNRILRVVRDTRVHLHGMVQICFLAVDRPLPALLRRPPPAMSTPSPAPNSRPAVAPEYYVRHKCRLASLHLAAARAPSLAAAFGAARGVDVPTSSWLVCVSPCVCLPVCPSSLCSHSCSTRSARSVLCDLALLQRSLSPRTRNRVITAHRRRGESFSDGILPIADRDTLEGERHAECTTATDTSRGGLTLVLLILGC